MLPSINKKRLTYYRKMPFHIRKKSTIVLYSTPDTVGDGVVTQVGVATHSDVWNYYKNDNSWTHNYSDRTTWESKEDAEAVPIFDQGSSDEGNGPSLAHIVEE